MQQFHCHQDQTKSKKKHLNFWVPAGNGKGSTLSRSSDSIPDQVHGMNKMISIFQGAVNTGSSVVIGGDLNIDKHIPNVTLERPVLKELFPLLEDFMINNSGAKKLSFGFVNI